MRKSCRRWESRHRVRLPKIHMVERVVEFSSERPFSFSVIANCLFNDASALKDLRAEERVARDVAERSSLWTAPRSAGATIRIQLGGCTSVVAHPVRVPAVATANQPFALGFATEAFPTRFTRQGPVSSSLRQSRYDGVNGMPDCQVQTPEIASRQPRNPQLASMGHESLALPNGNS